MLRDHLNSASRDEQDLHLGEGERCSRWDKQPEQQLAHSRHLRKHSWNGRGREDKQGSMGVGRKQAPWVHPWSSEGPAKPTPWRWDWGEG